MASLFSLLFVHSRAPLDASAPTARLTSLAASQLKRTITAYSDRFKAPPPLIASPALRMPAADPEVEKTVAQQMLILPIKMRR
jgi:hypothetical protein